MFNFANNYRLNKSQWFLFFSSQVLALCSYPALLEDSKFPEDAKKRAQRILEACGGHSIGQTTPPHYTNHILCRQSFSTYVTSIYVYLSAY